MTNLWKTSKNFQPMVLIFCTFVGLQFMKVNLDLLPTPWFSLHHFNRTLCFPFASKSNESKTSNFSSSSIHQYEYINNTTCPHEHSFKFRFRNALWQIWNKQGNRFLPESSRFLWRGVFPSIDAYRLGVALSYKPILFHSAIRLILYLNRPIYGQ